MILRDQLTSIGELHKPHGIKGEITASLDPGINPAGLRCIVLDIDGIFVPFFIDEARPKGADWLILIDGIANETQAAELANHEIFTPRADLADILPDEDDEDGLYLSDLVGWTLLLHQTAAPVGVIEDYDDSTSNALIYVTNPAGKKIIVPFAEDFITEIRPDDKTISMDLPQGIIDLND